MLSNRICDLISGSTVRSCAHPPKNSLNSLMFLRIARSFEPAPLVVESHRGVSYGILRPVRKWKAQVNEMAVIALARGSRVKVVMPKSCVSKQIAQLIEAVLCCLVRKQPKRWNRPGSNDGPPRCPIADWFGWRYKTASGLSVK